MTDPIVIIVSSATVATLVASGLAWLTRTWISERLKNSIGHEYSQRLETHKAQLDSANNSMLERLRADLQIAASEHQIRFSRLHEKQAEAVAETYRLLWELFLSAWQTISRLSRRRGIHRNQSDVKP